MPHDETGKINLLLHIIKLRLPTLTAFVICTFPLHKSFPAASIMFLVFYPKYIFHKQLLIAVFLTRKTWVSQTFCINLVSLFTYMCLRESARQTSFTEEADVLSIYSVPLPNRGFSLKRSIILICKHANCSIIYTSSKSQSSHYLYMTMYECWNQHKCILLPY